jgi:hypothetical protein
MRLYADEDFAFPVVEELCRFGHDVLRAVEDGRKSTTDAEIISRAHFLGRAVLTHNRWDFELLHQQGIDHSGILSATQDPDFPALAQRIHLALAGVALGRWHIRVYKLRQ